jgi:uncharacterized protein YpmB
MDNNQNVINNPIYENSTVAVPAPQNINNDQEKFINRWSFGAFSLSIIYFFASGLIKQGLFMFIPFYNIYIWIKGIVKGRKMSWEKGEWKDFETFKKRQKMLDRIGIVLVIIFVVFFALILFFVSSSLSAPTKTANNFMDDLAAGQVQSAYDLTSSKLHSSASADEFRQLMSDESSGLSQIQSYGFNYRSAENKDGISEAVMSGSLTLKDGRTTPLEVDLAKENGVWKVAYVATGSDASNPSSQ